MQTPLILNHEKLLNNVQYIILRMLITTDTYPKFRAYILMS